MLKVQRKLVATFIRRHLHIILIKEGTTIICKYDSLYLTLETDIEQKAQLEH